MEVNTFVSFSALIGFAAVFAIVATKLKQPAILGYIIAGIVIGMLPLFHPDHEQLELFSKIGITLLLFVLGLELNISDLKLLGKVAVVTAVIQVLFSAGIGFIIAKVLGFSTPASFFVGIGLAFSSTIVVVKLLSLKKQLDTLHGKISIGFLLVQDFIAILLLIGLSAFGHLKPGGGINDLGVELGITAIKGLISAIIIFLFVKFILHPILNWIRGEKEVLFVTVIAWALLLATLMGSELVGFSIEIGGLIAGIALSDRFEHMQIESWTKPLRDFFLMLFFVLLGLQINIATVGQVIVPALIISAIVVISKPFIVLLVMRFLGYPKRISFLVGLSIAQVSEFSLIVAKFGFDLGHVDISALTLLTIIGGITMTISSYMIMFNEQLYEVCKNFLDLFGFKSNESTEIQHGDPYKIILFGCHRMGQNLIELIQHHKSELLIVDIDPKTIKRLKDEGYNTFYGDLSDLELYDAYRLHEAEIVISTVPSIKENKRMLTFIASLPQKPITIMTAGDDAAARELYRSDADFVVYPHLLGSELLSDIVSKKALSKSVVKIRGKHLERFNVFSN